MSQTCSWSLGKIDLKKKIKFDLKKLKNIRTEVFFYSKTRFQTINTLPLLIKL